MRIQVSIVASIAALVSGLALAGCGGGRLPPPGPPPNVLLLVVDCLRADRLSALGYHRPTTPNLDGLVAEGVTFERAFAQTSWTRPSLPTILTGLYPAEHNLQDFLRGAGEAVMSPRLAPEVETLPEALKPLGYRTAMIGEQVQLAPRFGLAQGFDYYRNDGGTAETIHGVLREWLPGAGRPFFAYLHYLDIHWPYCPPREVRGTFYSGDSRLGICSGWRRIRKQLETGELVPDEDDLEALRGRYDEELLALDRELGRLFSDLRSRGLWDDTLVIVTSDHGEQFFEHGASGHGIDLYDELIAVPLVFKPPASWPVPRGRRVPHLVENRDVAPTVLEAVGGPPLPGVSAPSLLPWMRRRPPAEPPHRFVIAESGTQVAVRTAEFKLIADREGDGYELYSLADDPGEQDPIEDRRKLAELRGYLSAWETGLQASEAQQAEELDQETVEELKALGYLGD